MSDVQPSTNGHATESDLTAAAEAYRALEASIFVDRLLFARQHGLSFNDARDMYAALGYDRVIPTWKYRARYLRGGIARRVVEALPKATWRGGVYLRETEDPKANTDFEKAWDAFSEKFDVPTLMLRADVLSRISTFAAILIGGPGDDVSQELPKGNGTFKDIAFFSTFIGSGDTDRTTVAGGALNYVDATVAEWEKDPKNARFGLPKAYKLRNLMVQAPELDKNVHWTRVVHVAEGVLDNEVYSSPALEPIWNLLDDLDKITGGGAEAFWMRANQGLNINLDKDMDLLPEDKAKLQENVDKYKHGMDRILKTRGADVRALGSDVANFANQADAVLTQIAGTTTIPKRILTGSEMGELASSQDRDNWRDQVNGRQTQYAGPYMLKRLAERLIAYNYLPTPPKGYTIVWPHIQTMTETEKAAGALSWAMTNKTQGATVYTDDEIRDHWYGMEPLPEDKKQQIAQPVIGDAPVTALEAADAIRALEAAIVAGDAQAISAIVGVRHA